MAARVARLQARMVEQGIGLSLFDEMEALFWLSGYANSENRWRVSLVPASGEPFFVIRAPDAAALRDRSWLSNIVTFRNCCGKRSYGQAGRAPPDERRGNGYARPNATAPHRYSTQPCC
jgi:Xaa-Pro aminopeptidase